MNILSINPEFQRNVWIELTPQRLILMPLVIGLVIFIISGTGDSSNSFIQPGTLSLILYTIIALGWGTKSAGEALLDEHNDKTWDWQRMSAIGPWKMLWGKLLGSTIYQWYGGFICLTIYIIAGISNGNGQQAITVAIMTLLFTVLGFCLVMLAALLQMKKSPERARIKGGSLFIIRFAIAIPIFTFAFVTSWLFDSTKGVEWFGISFSPLGISFFFVSFYTVWAVIGLYRGLRSELQYVTGSMGWIGFLLTAIVFNAGLMANIKELTFMEMTISILVSAFIFYLIIVYYMALNEAKDVVNLRLVLNTIKSKNLKKLGEISPLWLITLPLAFAAGILALLCLLVYTPNNSFDHTVMELKNVDKTTLIALLISVFGFVVRDLALLLWINFNTSARRADIASWVYLIFIYYLLPSVSGGNQVGFIFFPDPSSNALLLIFVPLLEAVLAIYILKGKWNVINEKLG